MIMACVWEAKSAELLTTPNVPEVEKDIKMDMPIKGGGVQEVTFKTVDCMQILGSMVDSMGTPRSLLQNRLAAAQRAYWTKIRLWRGRSQRKDKLLAWTRFIHPIALHGLRTIHIGRQLLHTIRTWEMNMLRNMMKFRRRVYKSVAGEVTVENQKLFNKRTNALLHGYFEDTDTYPLHEKVLKMVFKEAWRLKNPTQQLAGGADYLRGIKDDMWWNGLKDLSGNKRTTGDTKHRRSGPTTSWETPLVQGVGADWRDRREQSSKEEWKERSDEACEALGRKWDLWLRSKTKSEEKEPPKKKQKVEEVKPTQKWRQEDSQYSGCPGKILLVTDNESLSKIVNGA